MTGPAKTGRTCVYSLEPGVGGVLAKVHAVAALHASFGHDVALVYGTPGRQPTGWRRRLRSWIGARPRWETTHGLRGLASPAWPGPPWLQYALPLVWAWPLMRRSDMHVVVSGSNHCGLPAAMTGRRYVIWIGTLYEAELAAKAEAGDRWARRVLRGPARQLLARQERFVFDRAALILANGPHAAEAVRRAYPHVASRLREVIYPVDTTIFRPDPAARRHGGPPYVLFTGRVNDPRKNVGMLLRAFARVRAARPDVSLVLAGQRPGAGVMRVLADTGLADAVRFVGHLPGPALVALYQGAELFVLPSLQEGLGISMLEALACGVPVVATRCGGPEPILVEGQTGRLVPNNAPDALAAALLELLAAPARVAAMRECCVEFAARRFARDRTEAALLDAFRSVYPDYFAAR